MDNVNAGRTSQLAVWALIISFLAMVPFLGLFFLLIDIILIIAASIAFSRNENLGGRKLLTAAKIICTLVVVFYVYLMTHPAALLKIFAKESGPSLQKIDRVYEEVASKEGMLPPEEYVIAEAKKLENGDELIKTCTLADGTLDRKKLLLLVKDTRLKGVQTTLNHIDQTATNLEQMQKDHQASMKQRDEYQVQLSVGWRYEEQRKYDSALEAFSKAVDLFPDEETGYSSRARTYFSMRNFEAAVGDLSRAIELIEKRGGKIGPPSLLAYAARGDAYRQLKKYDLAEQDYTTAIAIDNHYWQYLLKRGLLYREAGNIEKAKEDWQKAIELGMKLDDLQEWIENNDGTRHSVWYYPNGNVKSEGGYRGLYPNLKRNGFFKWFNEDGTLRKEQRYADDAPVNN